MDWSQITSEIINWTLIILGSISIPTVIGWVLSIVINKKLNKHIDKTQQENAQLVIDASTEAVEKSVGKIKAMTFKHDIEPIVSKKLEDGIHALNKETIEKLDQVSEQNKHIVDLIDKFSVYFDDSYYIEDSKKEAFKNALDVAKADYIDSQTAESVIVEEEHHEDTNKAQNAQNESQNTQSIQR